MATIMERVGDAEFEAISNIFGVSPSIKEEKGGRNDSYYFYHIFNFHYDGVSFMCKLIRWRYADESNKDIILSGLLNCGERYNGYSTSIGNFTLDNPDDVRSIEREVGEAWTKLKSMTEQDTMKGMKKMDFKSEFDKQIAKNRGNDVKKYGYSRFINGMEEFVDIEEPMGREEAKKFVLNRLGTYADPDWVRAILSLIADGNEKEYKNLYDAYFENSGRFD